MQGKNHVGLAIAGGLALALAGAPSPPSLAAWGLLIVGSLAPDIDGAGTITRPSKFLPDIIPSWAERGLDRVGIGISRLVQKVVGHRGGLHWPLWGALMIWAGGRYGYEWLIWFGAGYLLHLLGDMLTVAGIPLLGPLSQKKISLFPMRTGGKLEAFIGLLIWLFVLGRVGLLGLDRAGPFIQQADQFIDRLTTILSLK